MSLPSQTSSSRLRLHRAQSLLSEIISVRASLGQIPQETAELPLTGLMSQEETASVFQVESTHKFDLHEFAPLGLNTLKEPEFPMHTMVGQMQFDDQEELMVALREASEAHTGQTDELLLNPSTDLESALKDALEDALDEVPYSTSADESLQISQPTPIAYHPNPMNPMKALWGRKGFTPTPEVITQKTFQSTAPRLAFEESQELLDLVKSEPEFNRLNEAYEPSTPDQGSVDDELLFDHNDLDLIEDAVNSNSIHDENMLEVPDLAKELPLKTAAYAPLSEVELEPNEVQEGFGGMPSSPDEPDPQALQQAWSELADSQKNTQQSKAKGYVLLLGGLLLGGVGLYYYYFIQ